MQPLPDQHDISFCASFSSEQFFINIWYISYGGLRVQHDGPCGQGRHIYQRSALIAPSPDPPKHGCSRVCRYPFCPSFQHQYSPSCRFSVENPMVTNGDTRPHHDSHGSCCYSTEDPPYQCHVQHHGQHSLPAPYTGCFTADNDNDNANDISLNGQ